MLEKTGALSSLQGTERLGWRSAGVPTGGAADPIGWRLANALVGNPAGALAIEVAGGLLRGVAQSEGWLGLAGQGGSLWVDGRAAEAGSAVFVEKDNCIEVRPNAGGQYAYLSVRGGWQGEARLGSASTCLPGGFGGWQGRRLLPGDELETLLTLSPPRRPLPRINLPAFDFGPGPGLFRVLPGPEAGAVPMDAFFGTEWQIARQGNRMAIRLEGPPLPTGFEATMPSANVMPGTVQLLPSGLPLVLGVDAQSTGGYPRVAQVIGVDLPRLAQLPPGSTCRFLPCDLRLASQLREKLKLALRKLVIGDW